MVEQTAFNAFNIVLKRYLANGEPGIAELKRDLASANRSPVLTRFCAELYEILQEKLPVPTDQINVEFQRRAVEAIEAGELAEDTAAAQFTDADGYEMCADLWSRLELEVVDDESGIRFQRPSNRRLRSPLAPGDPGEAFKTWISLPLVIGFLGGLLVCVLCYWLYGLSGPGFLGTCLLLMTLAGFLTTTGSAVLLWLRRIRYVDPDAFLSKPKERRSRER
jgi:hypothetical protein